MFYYLKLWSLIMLIRRTNIFSFPEAYLIGLIKIGYQIFLSTFPSFMYFGEFIKIKKVYRWFCSIIAFLCYNNYLLKILWENIQLYNDKNKPLGLLLYTAWYKFTVENQYCTKWLKKQKDAKSKVETQKLMNQHCKL